MTHGDPRERFLEAREENKKELERRYPINQYSFGMLTALRDMAERDIYPDGRFGDVDCEVWSLFHMLMK